ncbi:MAG TPA: hypothetical protein VN048_12435 [Verrucomicrobiae bacterium]|jgi:hypothetical protein|nr:hypothetical protein [Verrucomicrobiae bacterium]
MKTNCTKAGPARNARGMTLVEMMTTTALFTLTVAGLIAVNLFGLKQDEFLNSQIGASDQSRMEFNLMLQEIRSGKNVQIGTGWSTNFTPITNGAQQGDTIQIAPSTNFPGTGLIYYYFYTNPPSNANWLVRVSVATDTNGITTRLTNTVASCIANTTNQWMTNALNFSALGFNGTSWVLLTNDPTTYSTHNYIVTCLLQFYQYQYPLTYVGTNCLYDYYQINLQAARRAP